jgi:holo-[acyl-carrier protein] synthase
MQILGHGIDIVNVDRIRRLLVVDSREDFLDGWFTEEEQAASPGPIKETEYFAGRLASKEAIAKALGTGFSGDVTWTDVQIVSDSQGALEVVLVNEARSVGHERGITRWYLSLSHTEDYAIASAIATGAG